MKKLSALILAIALTGCAQMGLTPAKSFDQEAAYAEGIVTAVRNSTTASLTAGSIKVSDAQQIEKLAEQADFLIISARSASLSGDTSTALSKLAMATAILTQLQTFVKAK